MISLVHLPAANVASLPGEQGAQAASQGSVRFVPTSFEEQPDPVGTQSLARRGHRWMWPREWHEGLNGPVPQTHSCGLLAVFSDLVMTSGV